MLDSEWATAHGIKCKATRKAVLKSLTKLIHMLLSYIPTQCGVAMFSNGVTVVPPSPVSSSIYHCGKSSYTEPLISNGEEKRTIGVVAITRSRCVVLRVTRRGDSISTTILTTHTAQLRSTRRGSQSAARYERLNNSARLHYIREVTDRMKSLEEVIVLGPDPIKNMIHSKSIKAVYTTEDISHTTIVNTVKQYCFKYSNTKTR